MALSLSSFCTWKQQPQLGCHSESSSSLAVAACATETGRRTAILSSTVSLTVSSIPTAVASISALPLFDMLPAKAAAVAAAKAPPDFFLIPDSGGVKALELRAGSGDVPIIGDKVAIHYFGRLAAKQGWRFDSTYDHKDQTGDSVPFVFTLGSRKVISGIEAAVKSMRVGGIRRVVIPPSQGFQNTSQEPQPPNFFDRQRLFTTIFNPTRLANGEGSTLGTLVFDIELVSISHQ